MKDRQSDLEDKLKIEAAADLESKLREHAKYSHGTSSGMQEPPEQELPEVKAKRIACEEWAAEIDAKLEADNPPAERPAPTIEEINA